jgi:hypothetical protein
LTCKRMVWHKKSKWYFFNIEMITYWIN